MQRNIPEELMKIFISSTSRDLLAHRAKVISALQTSNQLPIVMETFNSAPGDAKEISLEQVQRADLFIGLYAKRYGFRPDDDKSITELEYLAAKEKNIPCFIFIHDDSHADDLIDAHAETDDESITLLKIFKRRLEKEAVRALFTDPDTLAQLVLKSLLSWYSQEVEKAKQAPPQGNQTVTNIKNAKNNSVVGNNFNSGTQTFNNNRSRGKKRKNEE
jgi:hypothetical protein